MRGPTRRKSFKDTPEENLAKTQKKKKENSIQPFSLISEFPIDVVKKKYLNERPATWMHIL